MAVDSAVRWVDLGGGGGQSGSAEHAWGLGKK